MNLGAVGRLLPELTGDARADRWREHRAAVRAELIEATLRAIDEYGPDLSIDDVVKTAGIPRPKLYRFFADKDALFAAVGQRVQELIIEQVVPQFDAATTALELVSSAVAAYVGLVDKRPNLFRFLVNSHFRDGRSPADLIEGGRPLSDATVDAWSAAIEARGGEGANFEYVVDAALGAVGLGVLRWLNSPTVSKDALVEELTAFLWGAFSAIAEVRGVHLTPDTTLESPAKAN
ncbi:TetR family transcriptional regulator [Mycobacterium intracellulare subsp. chimaera]|jgi:AcrR family transcriptional regulator|uniref:TetR/AcrR family transcriptional regulator n=1 Tax=Mycobacterium intracellulare TaxID=1767 RepID=UPI0008595276|nr:TetR/AcrR family transcriptional regulator [Mycobacterium intracellulare]AOS94322.1 TetR family transcriptional regulator [Mycobacterium intracellulare subsp. chimaera]